MKLRTVMKPLAGTDHIYPFIDLDHPSAGSITHDAAAAHALMRAIDDAASAEDGWANIYAERIRKRADEFLHEWGFEQDKAE